MDAETRDPARPRNRAQPRAPALPRTPARPRNPAEPRILAQPRTPAQPRTRPQPPQPPNPPQIRNPPQPPQPPQIRNPPQPPQPPPPANVYRPVYPDPGWRVVPNVISSGPTRYPITMAQYLKKSRPSPTPNRAEELVMQKRILDVIRDMPIYWKPGERVLLEHWRQLGIHIHFRWNVTISVVQLKEFVKETQETLKDKLRQFILRDKFTKVVIRAMLFRWNLYTHFDYYHKALRDFEAKLRKIKAGRNETRMRLTAQQRVQRTEVIASIADKQAKMEKEIVLRKCRICKIPWGFEIENIPRVLACGDTYCERCITKLQHEKHRSQIWCPLHKSNSAIRGTDIRELPVNYHIREED